MAKKAATGGAGRTASAKSASPFLSKLVSSFRKLGPGIVTGAADDDPSGIATYSQVGAQFGFAMLWTMLVSYPLMAGIQEISAWIGRVTGVGLAGNIRRHYPPIVVNTLVAFLLIANVINLGADIGAMGSALQLVVGGPALLYSVVFGVISVIAAIVFPYKQYAEYLKWSTLVLFVYAATALVVKFPLMPVLLGNVHPNSVFFECLSDRADCSLRNHDKSISLLLAGLSGSGGTKGCAARKASQGRAPPGAGATRADAKRHLSGHGIFQHHRLLHHPRHRRRPARSRYHRHSDRSASRRSAAAAGR